MDPKVNRAGVTAPGKSATPVSQAGGSGARIFIPRQGGPTPSIVRPAIASPRRRDGLAEPTPQSGGRALGDKASVSESPSSRTRPAVVVSQSVSVSNAARLDAAQRRQIRMAADDIVNGRMPASPFLFDSACAKVFNVATMFPQPREADGVHRLAQAVIAAAEAYADKAAPLQDGQSPQKEDVNLMLQTRDSAAQLRNLLRSNQSGFDTLEVGYKVQVIRALKTLDVELGATMLSKEANLAWSIVSEARDAFDRIHHDSTSPDEKVQAYGAALAQLALAGGRMESFLPKAKEDALAQHLLDSVAAEGIEARNDWAGSPLA